MRYWSPYELTQLLKYNIDPDIAAKKFPNTIPVEYITGFCEFYGHEFKVNQNTLIPRVETEQIIDIALENLPSQNFITFADVGTGSGIIGISFALELLRKEIAFDGYLSDISELALEVARENINKLLPESKFKILISNLLNSYPKGKKFDIIFANLPYIPESRISQLESNVKDFEPLSALSGGEHGLDLIMELLEQAPKVLAKEGVVILEVDDSHVIENFKSIPKAFGTNFEMWDLHVRNDLNDKNRFWILKLK